MLIQTIVETSIVSLFVSFIRSLNALLQPPNFGSYGRQLSLEIATSWPASISFRVHGGDIGPAGLGTALGS